MDTLRQIITEHINYRRQIFQLAKADIIRTYSGTALGWGWAILKPFIFVIMYYVAFTYGLRVGQSVGEYTYFQWLIAGLIPWFYIRDIFAGGAASIRKHRYMVTKIKFPISVIPTFNCLSVFLVNAVLTAIMLVFFIISGKGPDLYWLQLPLYMFMMFFFLCIWSIFSSVLATISKDFLQLLRSLTMAIFWLSGVMFDVTKVNNEIFQILLKINPFTTIINGYRNTMVNKVWFWENWDELGMFVLVSGILLALAVFVYEKLKDDIPDVL